jgi:hypothetical protein
MLLPAIPLHLAKTPSAALPFEHHDLSHTFPAFFPARK